MLKPLIIAILSILAAGAIWYAVQVSENNQKTLEENTANQLPLEPELTLAEKFVQAFYEADLPELEPLLAPPEITGNEPADTRIRELAEQRGYRLQALASGQLVELHGVTVQLEVEDAWLAMQTAARNQGIYLGLVSGHRSVENQRVIFQTQLRERSIAETGQGYTAAQIAAGEADAVLTAILREYSIPGYSKHHSGYAIDITDTASDRSFEEFEGTPGHEWVSEDDYSNIRAHGFLPSYPAGVASQGPEPEPWEYVWVGLNNTQF